MEHQKANPFDISLGALLQGENIGLLTIAGVLSGLISGSMGQGSALTILPFFVIFNLVGDYQTAIGTTLLTILPPLSLFAIREYYKKGKVNVKAALYLMLIISFFSYIGSKITLRVDKHIIVKATAIVYSIYSIFWIYVAYTGKFIK